MKQSVAEISLVCDATHPFVDLDVLPYIAHFLVIYWRRRR